MVLGGSQRESEEVAQLKRELRIVTEEREIPKKATALFAREPLRFRFIDAEKAN